MSLTGRLLSFALPLVKLRSQFTRVTLGFRAQVFDVKLSGEPRLLTVPTCSVM